MVLPSGRTRCRTIAIVRRRRHRGTAADRRARAGLRRRAYDANPEFATRRRSASAYQSPTTPPPSTRYDVRTDARTLAEADGGARRLRPVRATRPSASTRTARDGARSPGLARLPKGREARTGPTRATSTATARTASHADSASRRPRVAPRPRGRLRDGPHPRRRRHRQGVARPGAHGEQDEHVHRFHRRRRGAREAGWAKRDAIGIAGAERRRAADGRGHRTCGRTCCAAWSPASRSST